LRKFANAGSQQPKFDRKHSFFIHLTKQSAEFLSCKQQSDRPIGEILVGFATSAGLEAFSDRGNGLNGTIPTDLDALSKLSSLSLSNNLLFGQIPVPIGKDFNLAVPLLRNNQLNGSIPMELGALSNLEEPDVGRNQLFGSIHPDLANCSRLSYLSPARNNRMGEIRVEVSQGEQLDEFFSATECFPRHHPFKLGKFDTVA